MRHRTAHTQPNRRVNFLLLLLVPIGIVGLLYLVLSILYAPKKLTSVLFLTDPIHVASFDPTQHQWSIITFPAATHVTGIQGLGEYAVDSLWNVAATEGSPSAVVLGSLTDELGVPVDYYLGNKQSRFEHENPVGNGNNRFFTVRGILGFLLHRYETNIPLPVYLSLTRAWATREAQMTHDITLLKNSGLTEEVLPDQSTINVFNRDQFDYITDDIFEDRSIRSERLRLAVFNTTGRPFLGSRVARILTKLGGNIIQVGNDSPEVDKCELLGSADELTSKTAQVIQALFSCTAHASPDEGRADLILKIGKVYERRFLPQEQ